MNYFVDIGGETKGPYTLEELAAMRRAKEVTNETLFSYEGLSAWYPLHFIAETLDAQEEPIIDFDKIESTVSTSHPAQNEPGESADTHPDISQTKTCPFCAEEINAKAIKCKHCGSNVSDHINPSGSPNNVTSPLMAALASLCCISGLGQLALGQIGKGLVIILISVVLALLTSGYSAIVMWPLGAIDAYMVAKKLQSGKLVGSWEFFPS